MVKNHIIKSFRVGEETYKLFLECQKNINLSNSDLARLLFNRSLKELITTAQKVGWENLTFAVREFK